MGILPDHKHPECSLVASLGGSHGTLTQQKHGIETAATGACGVKAPSVRPLRLVFEVGGGGRGPPCPAGDDPIAAGLLGLGKRDVGFVEPG